MTTLLQDLRHALRILLKRPAFTAIAVLTLGLGIGANTAIFTVVNAVLFRSLPYPEPERVMQVGVQFPSSQTFAASEPKFIFWRDENRSFKAMAAYQPIGSGINLSGGSEPEYVTGLRVSVDFFRAIGISPAAGRGFTEQEDRRGGERVAIISDDLWRRSFGSNPNLIGGSILLDGASHTVVGVMPPNFRFDPSADVMVPLRPSVEGDQDHNYQVVARLDDKVTPEQALADMQSVTERFRETYPNRVLAENENIGVAPLQETLTSSSRQLLLILLGAVGFVLLIACANVANLQLARAVTRQKEMAIRVALGASWPRLVRQLLTESILLSFVGAAAGLLLAMWSVDYLAKLIPEGLLPQTSEINLDLGVFAFTIAIAAFIGVLVGIAPAIQARRVDVNDSLKEGGAKGATARGRIRGALVVAEIALSLVLLIGAALLIQTFANLHRVERGFDATNVLTFQVSPRGQQYSTTASISDFNSRALERIRALPEIEAAAVTNALALSRPPRMPFIIEGQQDQRLMTQYVMATPDYFRVMKIPLRHGRDFAATDTEASEKVVVVNEAFARQYFSEGAIDKRLTIGRGGIASGPLRVIAVASDFKQLGLKSEAQPTVFVPVAQVPDPMMRMLGRFWAMRFVARTTSDPTKLVAAVKQQIGDLDATLAVTGFRSMDQVVAEAVAPERFNMMLVGLFAALGLTLAMIGIYGVMSYSVAQRTREIGIRIALGAQVGDVLRMILKQGLALAVVGVSLGLAGAFALTRLMESLLYGVTSTDAMTFLLIPLILTGVALAACFVPARRATKVDPMEALRYE